MQVNNFFFLANVSISLLASVIAHSFQVFYNLLVLFKVFVILAKVNTFGCIHKSPHHVKVFQLEHFKFLSLLDALHFRPSNVCYCTALKSFYG